MHISFIRMKDKHFVFPSLPIVAESNKGPRKVPSRDIERGWNGLNEDGRKAVGNEVKVLIHTRKRETDVAFEDSFRFGTERP